MGEPAVSIRNKFAMAKFVDSQGRDWTLAIDIAGVKRVKSALGVDLLSDVEAAQKQIAEDIVLLVDVLYVLVKPQADERKIGDEEFGRALNGEIIETATLSLLQEIADFFPPRKRAAQRKLLEKSQLLADKTLGLLETRIEALDPDQMVKDLETELLKRDNSAKSSTEPTLLPPLTTGEKTAGNTSTDLQASSGSILGP
jgi:hypothetical protein